MNAYTYTARIVNLFHHEPTVPTEWPVPRLDLANPVRDPQTRGPKSLAWCRQHIPGFRASNKDAMKAHRHTERNRAKVATHG